MEFFASLTENLPRQHYLLKINPDSKAFAQTRHTIKAGRIECFKTHRHYITPIFDGLGHNGFLPLQIANETIIAQTRYQPGRIYAYILIGYERIMNQPDRLACLATIFIYGQERQEQSTSPRARFFV